MTTEAAVAISAELREIYSHSTVIVSATSSGPFAISFPESTIWWPAVGDRTSRHTIRSTNGSERCEAVAEVVGAFAHLPVDTRDRNLRYGRAPGAGRAEYGVRFFPFVSSHLRLVLQLDNAHLVDAFSMTYPAEVRLAWEAGSLAGNDGAQLRRDVAHFPSGWRESLSWLPEAERPSRLVLSIPVRASGRGLAPTMFYPLLTWLASLVAIAVAIHFGKAEVVAAAVAASWAFLLQQWITSPRAHQVCLHSALFVVLAALEAAWGVAAGHALWIGVSVAALLLAVAADIVRSSLAFEYTGRLPRRWALPWSAAALLLERRRTARRRSAGALDFDHQQRDAHGDGEEPNN